MEIPCKRTNFLWFQIIAITFLVSCSTAEATPTALPTVAPMPPTPTADINAPVIIDLEDQSISDLERFPKIDLELHVTDNDHAVDEIEWQISGNVELDYLFWGTGVFISLPQDDWTGSETLTFEACDPVGLCDSQEITFTVRMENDAPVVSISGQIILPGENFLEINLDEVVDDEESEDTELIWRVDGAQHLSVVIEDNMATVSPPDLAWLGQETIHFEACDPEGLCGDGEATFWIMERSNTPVEVMYVGNAGFMLTIGDKKILVDALYRDEPIPSEVIEILELAEPPFDDVDLILATHIHRDHFEASMVLSHLEHNPRAIFVSSDDVIDELLDIADVQDRAIAIQLPRRVGVRTVLAVQGIGVEAMFLDHGGGTQNLGFIVTVNGRRFFHTGDMDPETVSVADLQHLGLPEKQIDIAFVAHFMLITEEQHAHILEGIQASYIIPMHYQFTYPAPDYELMETYFPDAIVFHESLETWVLQNNQSH